MTDSPSTSLVKMPCQRVEELARGTIAWAKAKRQAELAPFEDAIMTERLRRARVKRRWFRPSSKREDVISYLCRDYCWSIEFMFAGRGYERHEAVSRRLLLAAKESADGFVWVSVADLAVIS